MKQVIRVCVFFCILVVSCSEPYFPDINAEQKVMVVNGLITNEKIPYNVILSYAASFDSISTGSPLKSAIVNVTDNHGNTYFFDESVNGNYVSDPSRFNGISGYTYTLHVLTQNGYEYESDPQLLLPGASEAVISGEFDNKVVINSQTGIQTLSNGAKILADFNNTSDSVQIFRYSSLLLTQYFYTICPLFESCYNFYCWKTEEANPEINLTGGDYKSVSAPVKRHEVCFIADYESCYGLRYVIGPVLPDLTIQPFASKEYQFFKVHNRILYINQYRLNNAAYEYYKDMAAQLKSDGKLFDPIASQIIGNIKCISNPGNKAFGFFEASSVKTSAYTIDFRNLTDNQPSVLKYKYILPPEPVGCRINNIPSFWFY